MYVLMSCQYLWLIVAGTFDPTQQFYCHIETPTFYTPMVSQSDYYTTVLADDAAKKLIAQQMSVAVVWLYFYRLRSRGDNMFGSFRVSVRLSVGALLFEPLAFGRDFLA